VWPIEIAQFLAQKLKHHLDSELGALEAEFRPLSVGKPDYWGRVWLDVKFDSTHFFKKIPQSEFVCKSYGCFTEARLGYSSERQNMTQNRNRVRQNLLFVMAKS
jgi:hypothetical protein